VSGTFNKRLAIVWLVLTAMTLAYIWLDHSADDHGALNASTVVTVAAIVIALVETGVLVVVGWFVFARLETTMADEI